MRKTIALINWKGGTCKTTVTLNAGAGLAKLGKRTLVIDLDPQGNLTYSLGIKPAELRATIAEALEGKAGLELSGIIAAKAKEKQKDEGRALGGTLRQKSDKGAVDTKRELASIAGVSHDTIHKAKIIAAKYDGRLTLSREVMETLRAHFGDKVFKAVVRAGVKLAEAPSSGKSIFTYAPHSHAAEDYLALCKEIIKRSN